mgnify:CR=1 FL=1
MRPGSIAAACAPLMLLQPSPVAAQAAAPEYSMRPAWITEDGYGDVIVGAPQWDGGQVMEGRASVYVGTATGLTDDGRLCIKVYLEQQIKSPVKGRGISANGIPTEVSGIPVVTEVTGKFRAMADHKAKQTPPIQLGTSGGWRYDLANGYCCGGTLGPCAEHEVLVLARDANRLARIDQAHVAVLADHHGLGEGEDAGKGDVEVRQDADRRRLDHVAAEAVEISRPGAARVDRRGDAAGARQQLGLDAKRGAAPVHVGMQVDQARHDDFARYRADVLTLEVVADGGDLAAGKRDVGDLVEALRGVDHAAAL